MGNQESTSNPERYGEWDPTPECSHSRSKYRVVKLRWIRVPMANVHATNSVEAARWIASPVFAPLIDKTVKSDLSRECIEIVYNCRACDPKQSNERQKCTCGMQGMVACQK